MPTDRTYFFGDVSRNEDHFLGLNRNAGIHVHSTLFSNVTTLQRQRFVHSKMPLSFPFHPWSEFRK